MSIHQRAVIIAGPTGVGKTELAIRLAKILNGELISCDSVQVYKHLEIGSNKERIMDPPQHLIDFVELDEPFTAANFYEKCWECMVELRRKGKVPILVGGTGFYMDWLVRGRPSAPATDPQVLQTVDEEIDKIDGWSNKILKLVEVDPDYAKTLCDNDVYRLKRALVVHRQTGMPLSSFPRNSPSQVDWRCFYLTADRELLNKNIDLRCERMIQRGLIQETKELWEAGRLVKESTPGRSIGYWETIEYLESIKNAESRYELGLAEESFPEYLNRFKAATRQYSRRQENWFRRMHEFKWVERPDMTRTFDQSFVERLVAWYQMEPEDFEKSIQNVDAEVRDRLGASCERNWKRMKTYCSKKSERFDSREKISNFLEEVFRQ